MRQYALPLSGRVLLVGVLGELLDRGGQPAPIHSSHERREIPLDTTHEHNDVRGPNVPNDEAFSTAAIHSCITCVLFCIYVPLPVDLLCQCLLGRQRLSRRLLCLGTLLPGTEKDKPRYHGSIPEEDTRILVQ